MMKVRKSAAISASDAGRLLASFNGAAHARAARENGKLGGRPCYGVCSARELRRRIRGYVASRRVGGQLYDGQGRMAQISQARMVSILSADALAYRQELIDRMKASGKLGEDQAARLVFAHPLTATVEGWRRLVLLNPGLL